jgi:EAL domain-containing protein (putative c-di-GMP-specific phosphodiesterase class I)/GGDEF domain-containing protein
VVTSVTSDAPHVDRWGPSPLTAFLTALAEAAGARVAYFVPAETDVAPARSFLADAIPDSELSALDALGRRWLSGPHADTAHMSFPGGRLVDIAPVRSGTHGTRGALLVEHVAGPAASTEPAIEPAVEPMVDLAFAAGLISVILDDPPLHAPRNALIEWADSQRGGRAAFAISVDHLGVANEVLGYQSGDAILRTLVRRMEQWAGPRGRVARAGGARYLAIRTDLTDLPTAREEADRLRAAIAAPVTQSGLQVSRSASIGVALDGDGAIPTAELIRSAVRSGAAARAAGGDEVCVFDAERAGDRTSRLRLELELHGALDEGQLRLHYQPEYDLGSKRIVAVEALLRWQHPTRGLLGAETFVPWTEHTHTFARVQRWVVEETCRQLARWLDDGIGSGLVVRVNIAAAQILHGDIAGTFAAALDRYQLPSAALCLELTERRLPSDLTELAAALHRLRSRGVTIAVDDFGTGDGTLAHLLTLPLDAVKIDQNFVRPMIADPRAAAIVRSVVDLAHALQLDVVAEGVDGPETVAALLELGCRRGQGNALATAAGPDVIESMLLAQGG